MSAYDRQYGQRYYAKNKTKLNAANKANAIKNKTKYAAARRKWYLENKNRLLTENRRARLVRTYGVSEEEYQQKVRAQDGMCAICGRMPEPPKRLAIDHDHTTGAVRGLLCAPCNQGIGMLGDSAWRLEAAALYIKLHQGDLT